MADEDHKTDEDLLTKLRDAAWQCAETARLAAEERKGAPVQAYAEAAAALTKALYDYQR